MGGRQHGVHRGAASRRLLAASCLLLLLAVACGGGTVLDEFGTVDVAPDQPIVVGVSVARTGDDTGDARRIELGVRLAVEETRTVKGRPVEVMVLDDACSADGSVAAARRFTTTAGVVGVIGPMCSRGCVPASLVYDDAKMVMITPSCTASVLTGQGLPTVFRIAWNDEIGAAGGARYAAEVLKARRVYAVNDQTFYGKTQRDAFKVTLEARGGTLIADETIAAHEWDFTALVADIKAARPDLIFFGGFPPAATFLIQQLRYAGVAAPFMGGDALLDAQRFVAASNGAADGVYVADARPVEGPAYAEFARRYRERWGEEPGPYSAQGYDAAQTLLRAVAKVATERRGALMVDEKALRDAIVRSDIRGASGRIRFWPNGERAAAAGAVVLRVLGDRFEVITEYAAE